MLVDIEWQTSLCYYFCSCFVKVNIETLLGDFLRIIFSLEVSSRALFPQMLSVTLTHCILPCVLMQKQSPGRRQKEAVRSRGAAERPNTPACEASETEEFRGWIIKFNF